MNKRAMLINIGLSLALTAQVRALAARVPFLIAAVAYVVAPQPALVNQPYPHFDTLEVSR